MNGYVTTGSVKQIELVTGQLDEEYRMKSDGHLDNLKRELDKKGVTFSWRRDSSLHDREIRTDNGWQILSGHGLHIFQKPASRNEFGQWDQTLKRCKSNKINIRKLL